MDELEKRGPRRGQEVRDAEDRRLGRLEDVYFDPRTDRPAYACVKVGLLGRKLSFVSLAGAALAENHIRLPQTRSQVKDAPPLRPELRLTSGEARTLSEHYAERIPLPRGTASGRPGPGPQDAAASSGSGAGPTSVAPGPDLIERLDALERRVQELQRTLG